MPVTEILHIALPDGHQWLRVADPAWVNPIDTTYSITTGGRWNPPGTWPALYLNENAETARRQIQRMLEGTPFGPDDLADDAYDLVTVLLPRGQTALDAVSAAGLTAVGLPTTYPTTTDGERVGHAACWPAATDAYAAGLDGVHCRSAATLDGLGRELAWWPRDQTATWTTRSPYSAWRSSP